MRIQVGKHERLRIEQVIFIGKRIGVVQLVVVQRLIVRQLIIGSSLSSIVAHCPAVVRLAIGSPSSSASEADRNLAVAVRKAAAVPERLTIGKRSQPNGRVRKAAVVPMDRRQDHGPTVGSGGDSSSDASVVAGQVAVDRVVADQVAVDQWWRSWRRVKWRIGVAVK